jgi:3-methyladenine DNA glycosylase AlkD
VSYSHDFVSALTPGLISLGDRKRAIGAQAYMKGIAPFIGVATPERRALAKKIAKSMNAPTSDELIDIHWKIADKNFLAEHVEYLITTKSWWDTVDGLGSVAVSPLSDKYGCEKLIEKWNKSSNIWLNRAAIQHQRGRKFETDVKLVLRYCDDHSASDEFFIVKAIGWALRDIAKINPKAVCDFLKAHPDLGRVAVREAERGLARL